MSTNVKAPAKEKNKLGSLVKAFKKYYGPFIVSIVLLITSVIFTILTPGMIRNLTNEISPSVKKRLPVALLSIWTMCSIMR